MEQDVIGWIVAAVAGLAAIGLFFRGKSSAARADEAETELKDAKSRSRDLMKRVGKKSDTTTTLTSSSSLANACPGARCLRSESRSG